MFEGLKLSLKEVHRVKRKLFSGLLAKPEVQGKKVWFGSKQKFWHGLGNKLFISL